MSEAYPSRFIIQCHGQLQSIFIFVKIREVFIIRDYLGKIFDEVFPYRDLKYEFTNFYYSGIQGALKLGANISEGVL